MKTFAKKRIYIYWGIFLFFLGLFLFFYGLFFAFADHAKLAERSNRLLHKEEAHALMKLREIAEDIDSHENHIEIKSSTVYLCYRNDTILIWSSNHDPVPYLLSGFDGLNQPTVELSNGIFRPVIYRSEIYTLLALIPLYHRYPVENDYFKNSFAAFLELPDNAVYSCDDAFFPLYSNNGDFLCSIQLPKELSFTGWKYKIIFIFFFVSYLWLFFCLYQTYLACLHHGKRNRVRLFYLSVLVMVVVAFFIVFFRQPSIIFNHPLFSSKYFAYSWFFPSLGQVFLLGLAAVLVSFTIYDFVNLWRIRPKKYFLLFNILYPLIAGILYFLFTALHKLFITNTTVFLDLSFIFSVNAYSVFLLITICCFSIALFLLNLTFSRMLSLSAPGNLLVVAGETLIISLSIAFIDEFDLLNFILSLLWIMIPAWLVFHKKRVRRRRYLFYGVILLGFFSVSILEYYVALSEKKHRLFLAEEISRQGRQEDKELLFDDMSHNILKDNSVRRFIMNFSDATPVDYDRVICDYITRTYLNKSWQGYHTTIHVCSPVDAFDIPFSEEVYSCFDFFDRQIEESGQKTLSENLFLLQEDYFSSSYLGVVKSSDFDTAMPELRFYIEMHPIHPYRESGYPEFIIEQNTFTSMDASRYSFAIYNNNVLEYSFGNVTYPVTFSDKVRWDSTQQYHFYNIRPYSQLRYRMLNGNTLIISTPEKNIPQYISPYIYMIAAYLLITYLLCLFINTKILIMPRSQLSAKLQRAIMLVLLLAFLLIGIFIFYFIRLLNGSKEYENLRQKTLSIISVFNRSEEVASMAILEPGLSGNENIALNLSRIFYADINIYSPQGRLISTSSPVIFEQGLLSRLINYEVYCKIVHRNEHTVIRREYIGDKRYLSSYSAIYDADDHLIAILNVTYFSYSGQYEYEITSFISTFINIYIIVFLIFLATLLYLSNQITRPLRLLTQYFGKMRIGMKNEKIIWKSADEFSKLIESYNRMIDDLEISARRLADSERESGWRDMAQQVAHEIKNPLTPMRLNIQHLQRTWQDSSRFSKEQMERFCNTLIQQIDALSEIADEFSNFATLPKSHRQPIKLNDIIEAAVGVYDGSDVKFHVLGFENISMNADPGLLLRVFNNLIKNSVQSFDKNQSKNIWIEATREPHRLKIIVKDDGCGIPDEMLPRIFIPTFTTRSTGMGLGLSVVKTIIEEHNGTIAVTSESGEGTAFTMIFDL